MPLSVDILSVLLLVTLFQGIFILSVLIIRHRLSSSQHRLLFFMIAALIWFQAEFLSIRLPYDVRISLFYGTRYGAWFLIGPLYYFYVHAIVATPFKNIRVIILHFAPFLIFSILIPLITEGFLSSRQEHYGMLTPFDPFNESVSFLQYIYASVFILQFSHLLVYLVISLLLISRYEKNLKGNYSTIDIANIRWLKTVNILLLAVLVFAALFLIIFFVSRSYNRNLDYLYVFPMALLVYIVGYKLAGVEWPLSPSIVAKQNKYEKSSLKAEQAKQYRLRLEEYMTAAKPFLNNELRLNDLADMVSIPSHHLSQVINEHFGTTFFDFINRYRVEEAKKLIKSEPESSLLEISFKAGFNNKTSFTNAFRKFTTQTPVEFKGQQKALKN